MLLYLASWIPIGALLTAIVTRNGGMPLMEAVVILLPMCLLYAFICQGSWYVCQALPLRESGLPRLIGTHATASLAASAAWVGSGLIWAFVVGITFELTGAAERYLAQLPILFLSGVLLFLLAIAFNYLLITFEASQRAEQKALELQVLGREAELKVLRAQIDPHFLFNSLNSINALITADPAGARRMCVLLAEFLRGCLKLGSAERISLDEEIQLAQHYLSIEKVRLGSRLTIETDVESTCKKCLVPPLILQPLIENAITHGVSRMLEGGTVRIEARQHGDAVRIVVENPFEAKTGTKNGIGLGIKNVRMRLANLFNSDAQVNLKDDGGQFRIELHMPCDRP